MEAEGEMRTNEASGELEDGSGAVRRFVNLEVARELLPRAVATQGEYFVYCPDGLGACHYEALTAAEAAEQARRYDPLSVVPKQQTGCLVGVVLDTAGISWQRGAVNGILHLAPMYPEDITPAAARYLSEAQDAQDGGATWGAALAAAEELVGSEALDGYSDAGPSGSEGGGVEGGLSG